MTAHTLICRLGPSDKARIRRSDPSTILTSIPFIASKRRLEFGIGQALDQLSQLGLRPTEIALDLAIVGAIITAADTRVSRAAEAHDDWTREFDIHVPVSDPVRWKSLIPLLQQMTNFLTGDRWMFHFRERPKHLKTLVPRAAKLKIEQPSCVALFSGGLDSFIGAIDLLKQKEKPLFVSHYWDGITSDHQNYCADRIEKHFKTSLLHMRARVGFPTGLINGAVENTLRARSFMFFALAALAASGAGKDLPIYVPENGLISLNVPLDALRLGALSTRTTHPFYMARWDDLLAALDIPSHLENPYRYLTKGEMITGCCDQGFLRRFAKNTMSCSSPAKARWKGETPKHCGHCVPCIIRRAAMKKGFGADDTTYQLPDLSARELDSRKAEGEHVRAFQLALARLKARPQSARFQIHQPGPLSDYPKAWKDFQAVYVNGMREVAALLKGAVAKPL